MKKKSIVKNLTFHLLIYKNKEGYVGLCYETGFVDIWPTMEETKKHLENGVIALIKTVAEGKLSEKVLNRKLPLKYRFLFYFIPLWYSMLSFCKSLRLSFSLEPFTPDCLTYS